MFILVPGCSGLVVVVGVVDVGLFLAWAVVYMHGVVVSGFGVCVLLSFHLF